MSLLPTCSLRETHSKEASYLPRDHQSKSCQKHLRKLDVEHEVERSHVMLAHKLVLIGTSAPIEAERHEQQRQPKNLHVVEARGDKAHQEITVSRVSWTVR